MHRPRPHVSQLAMSTAGCRAQARGLADEMRGGSESGPSGASAPHAAPGTSCVIQSARAWTVDGVWLGW